MNALAAFIPCTLLCAHKSHFPHFIHPSPALLFEYTSQQYKHGVGTVVYLSPGYLAVFPVTTCTRLGLGCFYRLWLQVIQHWCYKSGRLNWAPCFPLWLPSTVAGGRNFCLQCDASIVNTCVWLERWLKCFINKTLKSQLCSSSLAFALQLACNAFHGALSRWIRN